MIKLHVFTVEGKQVVVVPGKGRFEVKTTTRCANGHAEEITPATITMEDDGYVSGRFGSDADFCGECERQNLKEVWAEIATFELTPWQPTLRVVEGGRS